MSVIVYIWETSETDVGHTSMQVGDEYISFWPSDPASKKDVKIKATHIPAFPRSYSTDCRVEKRDADSSIIINGLDESKIIETWNFIKKK